MLKRSYERLWCCERKSLVFVPCDRFDSVQTQEHTKTQICRVEPRTIPGEPKHKFARGLLQIQFGHCLYRIQIDPRTLAKLPWKVFG